MKSRYAALPFALMVGTLASSTVRATDDAVLEPPPLPQRVKSGEVMDLGAFRPARAARAPEREPSGRGFSIDEYHVRGRVVRIRVRPGGGAPAYFFTDADGDGEVDEGRESGRINTWQILAW